MKQDQESKIRGQCGELLSRLVRFSLPVHSIKRSMKYLEEIKWLEDGSIISLSKFSKEDCKGILSSMKISGE